jgi:WD40 repeat protein
MRSNTERNLARKQSKLSDDSLPCQCRTFREPILAQGHEPQAAGARDPAYIPLHARCHFSLDGRLLATGSDDGTVRLWDPTTGATIQTLEGYSGSVQAVAFSPDGRLLASGSGDDKVRLWNAKTTELILQYNTLLIN